MKKIVVKHKLGSREKFVQKLAEADMEFKPAYYQHDRIYVPRSYKPNANYARMTLRTEIVDVNRTPRYTMILKRHIADSGITVENSTVVKDYTESVKILQQLGFEKKAEISRRREELKLSEGSKMYLDRIEGLPGYYVKIENEILDDEQVWELRSDAVQTFEFLGIKENDEVKETYADLKAESK